MTGEATSARDEHARRNLLSATGLTSHNLPAVAPRPWHRTDDKFTCFADPDPVSAFNVGRRMEVPPTEVVDRINAAVEGLLSKIGESLGDLQQGVSVEAAEAVRTAPTSAAIADALERHGLTRSARRLTDLAALGGEDPDEPEIDLDSLRRAVVTLLEHLHWGEPSITLRGAGLVSMEWQTRGGGTVSMSFLPRGRVSYSALSAPATTPDFLNIGGRHLQEEAIGNLRWFTDRIVPR